METLISCEFNMDTACVELNFVDGSMVCATGSWRRLGTICEQHTGTSVDGLNKIVVAQPTGQQRSVGIVFYAKNS